MSCYFKIEFINLSFIFKFFIKLLSKDFKIEFLKSFYEYTCTKTTNLSVFKIDLMTQPLPHLNNSNRTKSKPNLLASVKSYEKDNRRNEARMIDLENEKNGSINISMSTKIECVKSLSTKADKGRFETWKSKIEKERVNEKTSLLKKTEEKAEFTDYPVMKCLCFPLLIIFRITIPKPTKYCFFFTFGLAIAWISALTYLCVWMVTVIGRLSPVRSCDLTN